MRVRASGPKAQTGEGNGQPFEPVTESPLGRAALIALVYALVGAIWIFGSDFFAGDADGHQSVLVAIAKGLFYIALTTVALFFAVLSALRRERRLADEVRAQTLVAKAALVAAERDRVFTDAVLDTIPDRIWVFTAGGRIRRANAAGWRVLGRSGPPDHALDLDTAGWPEESRELVRSHIAQVSQTREPLTGRLEYRRGDATLFADYANRPLVDPETGRVDVLGVGWDVTEQVVAERTLARKNRMLTALVSGLIAMQGERDRTTLGKKVTQALVDEAGFALACITEVEGEDLGTLTLLAAAGPLAEKLPAVVQAIRTRPGIDGPMATAIRTREPCLWNDFGTRSDLEWTHELLGPNDLASCAVVPMQFSGRLFGVLAVVAREELVFKMEDLEPLVAFADQLSRALTTLDSYVRYEESEAGRLAAVSRAKEALIETVGALAAVVEVRDPYTAGHQRKVSSLAVEIARELGWSDDRLEGVRIGALLHDIGKIAIPAELLTKPGRLTGEEFALIKTHAARGGELLRGIRFDWPILEMVTQHHERLDGSGYPLGLKDGEIAAEAKVLAVADVTEAMLAYRPYRQAIPLDTVVSELERGRGRLYDPAATDVALRLMRERGTAWFQEGHA